MNEKSYLLSFQNLCPPYLADKIKSIENNVKDSLPLPTAQEISELNLNLKTTLFNLQNENLGKYRYLALEEAQ